MSNTKCFKIINENSGKVKKTCLTQKEANNEALQDNNLTAMLNDDCISSCPNYNNEFQKQLKKQTSDSKKLYKKSK